MEKYFEKLIKDYGKVLSEELGEGNLKTKLVEGFKDVLNVDAVNFILDAYKNGILNKELGKGDLPNRIIERLEKILVEESEEKTENILLNKPFDYPSLFKENSRNLVVRISNCLKRQEIATYNDLRRECYSYFTDKNRGNLSWKNEKTYTSYLMHCSNLGNKSAEAIISHLSSVNFDFSEECARKSFEKSDK
ncbi:MAG: hypothetical protein Q8O84_01620 [Nanoarchaeota archaeon]|nr:hypothetical protein [Nanoarchaeota archaeon]